VLGVVVIVGVFSFFQQAYKVPETVSETERGATIERIHQHQDPYGPAGFVYFVRLLDGRMVSIASRNNRYLRVGERVVVVESKTADGGTIFEFKR